MFETSKKLILCATNSGMTVGLWHGTKLQTYAAFGNLDENYTAFSEYLSQHSNINVYLIVDAVEEDYKLESLPHTTGGARREIVDRKLNQFNRNSQYRAAHFINRAADKRKDDNFLFVALNNADFLQGWMDVIQANHAPLVGVYLLSMISQVIVRQMKYFYLVETDKTRLYLLSQRLIAGETPLQMVLPAVDGTYEEIARSISQEQGLECKAVDILAYARNLHVAEDLVKTHPEFLHMQLLANGNVPDNLAPATFSKIHNLNSTRRKINFATACVATVGVGLALFYGWQGKQQKDQLQLIAAQTQQQQQQYEEVAKNFPTTPLPSAELKVAADLAKTIKSNNQSPRQLMQVLSKAFETSPEIALSRIRWMQTNDREIKDEEGSPNPAQIQNNQPATIVNNDPTKLMQVGFINAEIKGFTGDYRAALNSVNNLVNHLRENSLVEQVVVLQEPVNVSSLANLQGSTTDENATTERPPAIFKLKIVLKTADSGASL